MISTHQTINAGSNLITTTDYITVGEFKGKPEKIQHPDGTLTLYSYGKHPTTGEITTTTSQGEPNGTGTAILAGRETVTIEGADRQLISHTLKDIASGIVTESRTITERDEQGRETDILYSDGTSEEKTYACCGVATFKDRNGQTTAYTYNSLKQLLSESRHGLTTLYSYDASGRVMTITRRGNDSSDIVIQTNTYDLAGRLTSRKNALDETTAFSESINGSGQKVATTTLPDTSTRVEITHRDGQLKEISGNAARPVLYEHGVNNGALYTKEILIGESNSQTEWTKTWRDPIGRTVTIEYLDTAESSFHYNLLGQLTKQIDPDGVTRLYTYNSLGEQTEQAIDLNADQSIGAGDRRTRTQQSVIAGPLLKTVVEQGTSSGYVTISITEANPNGRYRKNSLYGQETISETSYGSNGEQTTLITYPDGSTQSEEYENGQLQSSLRKANGGATIAAHTFSYDPHGRMIEQTDLRTNTSSITTYDLLDRPFSVTTGGYATAYTYNTLGQISVETLPGSSRSIARTYLPTGELTEETGTATYPVSYTYDPQGRRRTMTTSSGLTTWSYDSTRGWLTSKKDAANASATYTYTPGGRFHTRVWARGIITTYTYNNAGELTSTSYSDSTPSITLSYHETGTPASITDAAGTRSLTYNTANQPLIESHTSGLQIESTYDSKLRRTHLTATQGSTPLITTAYTFDNASRLATVTNGDQAATYSYLANSSLISDISFSHQSTPAMTLSKSYDGLNRLSTITSTPVVGAPIGYSYQYNAAGQRNEITLSSGDTWAYGYNSRGEVISGSKKQGGTTHLLGYQFGYAFDNIGNRTSSTRESRTSTYSTNNLNQYTSRTIPGYVNILGIADPSATVTVNDQPTTRQGAAFYYEQTADNSTDPAYVNSTIKAVLGGDIAQSEGKSYLPQTPEAYTYDLDGNLLTDGRWSYQWNGENRLIGMETLPEAETADVPKKRLTFTYDYQGRRITKKVENWKGTAYSEHYTMHFIYDGWNLIAEVLNTGARIRTYVWGSDLSGGTAAGGVGGLLCINQYPEEKTYSVGYDGNGNITGLYDLTNDGTIAAQYEYGPFGEALRTSGVMGKINPIKFSTKYTDRETELIYYGFRYYDAIKGRWPSRDPIEERGGLNLYGFVENDSINRWDYLGQTGIGEILRSFFWPWDRGEKLWVMDENDPYTSIVKDWDPVRPEIDEVKKIIAQDPWDWSKNHRTTSGWMPGMNLTPDSKHGWSTLVRSPAGTDPETAKRNFIIFVLTGIETDELHTSSIGSFHLAATVDEIDLTKCTAKVNIWMYNSMSRKSFGRFASHPFFSWRPMRTQWMWWNWKEEFKFDANGRITDIQPGESGW